ncbi:formyltransferase family protein [Candidatus Pelagibacter bacterium]|nr:formyltransferase family protein [Candidatus Pelagibacter bacterium]
MVNVVCIRESDYQNFFVNELYFNGIISHVIIENGFSFRLKRKISKYTFLNFLKLLTSPKKLFQKIYFALNFKNYFGYIEKHNKEYLGKPSIKIEKNISVTRFESLNDKKCLCFIDNLKPKNIFVYGTGMIKKEFLNLINSNIYNLHWGIAPKYRGAGLIPCIVNKDFKNLGVTFHKINAKSDAGDIYKTKNIEINKFDNFYSIHLKLTLKGIEIIKDFYKDKNPNFTKQNLENGKLYKSSYFKDNYKVFIDAFNNIKLIK